MSPLSALGSFLSPHVWQTQPDGHFDQAFVETTQAMRARLTAPSLQPGPDFSRQSLAGQNFARQNLQNADFSYADCTGVDFRGADLRGANFLHTVLTGALFDSQTCHEGVDFGYVSDAKGTPFEGEVGKYDWGV